MLVTDVDDNIAINIILKNEILHLKTDSSVLRIHGSLAMQQIEIEQTRLYNIVTFRQNT